MPKLDLTYEQIETLVIFVDSYIENLVFNNNVEGEVFKNLQAVSVEIHNQLSSMSGKKVAKSFANSLKKENLTKPELEQKLGRKLTSEEQRGISGLLRPEEENEEEIVYFRGTKANPDAIEGKCLATEIVTYLQEMINQRNLPEKQRTVKAEAIIHRLSMIKKRIAGKEATDKTAKIIDGIQDSLFMLGTLLLDAPAVLNAGLEE